MQLMREIEHLNQMLLKMADVVQNNINMAFDVYKNHTEIIAINDDIVDQYERLIEEICLDILIKERPYAKDLREVSGILKLIADLERIGDHAEDIMEFNCKLKDIDIPQIPEIADMVAKTLAMVASAIESFIKKDMLLAEEVIKADDEVDQYYTNIISELVVVHDDEKNWLPFAIYTTLVVKYIERIADHAVNIAEWVVYIINGFHKDKKIY
ncbi:MAG: phosphate signaling complex protein PhoU [Bacilli bacterium]|nr:phosphate signaling complex protein PhoU [Bacilli bacterium]MDD4056632.1 phosphate signaling complex protein PhoU [Bacilli bacterium]MDY0209287.1 phosphate signaling complex protein PhoU [Bacilli bacterium]